MKKTPKQRLHNPEGGGYKPSQQVHKLKKDRKANQLYEKIVRRGKVSLKDLRDLADLEEE